MSKNPTLILIASIFSVVFYMILQYTSLWDAGARDIIRVEGCRLDDKPYSGFVMGLLAGIPNFVIAALVGVGTVFGNNSTFDYAWADSLYTTGRFIGLFWESMYNGLIQLYSPNNPVAFFLIPLPGLFVAGIAYYAGMKNFRIIRRKRKAQTPAAKKGKR